MSIKAPADQYKDLLSKLQSEQVPTGANEYISKLVWPRIWATIAALCNAPAELSILLDLRAMLKVNMLLLQETEVKTRENEEAVRLLQEMYKKSMEGR